MAGAAALLTGCTSEVSGSAAPAAAPTAATPGSTTSSSPADDEELQETFCTEVPRLLADITADLEDVRTDPASAAAALDDAVGRMEEVEPPAGVADAWTRLVAVWSDLRDLVVAVDPADPGASADLAEGLIDLQGELVDAGTEVDEWGQANC
ncbi:hypothetical protein SAMN05660991_03161 [Trujillonella endophytica]|uniref:Uncharacterized protein n=1 Tax=Trujillonella endophytica TaxID=673521 RepID=A0A1H8UZL4_9ACTN|nr:hypothetical protein SAMN05660991_03161 [Trujillella endophytica]